MLEHSFCLFPGVGHRTEAKIWRAGLATWADALDADLERWPALAQARQVGLLDEAGDRLADGDAEWFAARLGTVDQWRLVHDFRGQVGYLDIETTGIGPGHHITAIALYDATGVRCFVHGIDLDAFAAAVAGCRLLCTYNGKSFDVPIIERELQVQLPRAHVDLRYLLKAVGLQGGLKRCEQALGLGRGELDGVDGYFAVVLWQWWRARGDPRALDTLCAYNAADVLSLEQLLAHGVNQQLTHLPFGDVPALQAGLAPRNPYQASPVLLDELRRLAAART